MFSLVKKDFYIYGAITYSSMAILILIMSLVTLPAVFIMIITIFSLVLSTFMYEEKNYVHPFLISLPVSKTQIVTSRYLYGVIISFMIVFFQWVVQWGLKQVFSSFHYVYHLEDFFIFFLLACMLIAFCLPVIYYFKKAYVSIIIIMFMISVGTYFMIDALISGLGETSEIIFQDDHLTIVFNDLDKGFDLLVHSYFPVLPYLLVTILCGILLVISHQLSIYIIKKRDY